MELRWLLPAILAITVSGCQTPYQDMGLTGGVRAEPITSDTFRIVSRGNGFTERNVVQDFTLLKAAETTRDAGATHFMIISAADASRSGVITTPATVRTTFVGNMAVSTVNPGVAIPVFKPGEDVYIRVFKFEPGQETPPGAFPAEEIIATIGPRVQRPR